MGLDRKYWELPWDVQSWLTSHTRLRLSLAAKGLFRELLDHQWLEGKVPDDIAMIAAIVGEPVDLVEPLWEEVKSEFPKRNSGRGKTVRRNRRMEVLRKSKLENAKVRRVSGQIGGRASAAKRATSERSVEGSSTNDRTIERSNEEEPPPTPSQRPAKPPPEVPRLDDVWERIKAVYPHPGNLRQAEISWQIAATSSPDPGRFADQVFAAAALAAEIHALDPAARNSRALPNLANFLDGGWREDRSGVLTSLKPESDDWILAKLEERTAS